MSFSSYTDSLFVIIILFSTMSNFSMTQYISAEKDNVPSWILHLARWETQGKISYSEYSDTIQYLFKQGLLQRESAEELVEAIQPNLTPDRDDKCRDRNFPNVNWAGCDFSETNLNHANLVDANLAGTSFEHANINKAYLFRANLIGAHLQNVEMINAQLVEANLSGANLTNANGSFVNLAYAILAGTTLSGADLQNGNFWEANLTNAKLSGANLSYTDMTNADLTGADLHCIGNPICKQ